MSTLLYYIEHLAIDYCVNELHPRDITYSQFRCSLSSLPPLHSPQKGWLGEKFRQNYNTVSSGGKCNCKKKVILNFDLCCKIVCQ